MNPIHAAPMPSAPWLIAAASINAAAAMLHLACWIWPSLFRHLGAGQTVAMRALQGDWRPYASATAVALGLSVGALYALAASGQFPHLPRLPALRTVVVLLTAVYGLRALAFPWLKPIFPGNSEAFWWTSSALCLAFAIVHAVGLHGSWSTLGRT